MCCLLSNWLTALMVSTSMSQIPVAYLPSEPVMRRLLAGADSMLAFKITNYATGKLGHVFCSHKATRNTGHYKEVHQATHKCATDPACRVGRKLYLPYYVKYIELIESVCLLLLL